MVNEEIMKLAVLNPDWLWTEYDIVQHALIDDEDHGLASFGVTYDNNYKIQFITFHPYGTTRYGTETLTIRNTNGIEVLENNVYVSAPADVQNFFKVFETYFDQAAINWLNY